MLRSLVSPQVLYRLIVALCIRIRALHYAELGAATTSLVLLTVAGTTTAVATVEVASTDFSLDDLDQLVRQSVQRIGGSLEIRGAVIGRADASGKQLETVQMTLGYFGQGAPVLLDPSAPADQRLVIDYSDDASYVADIPYTARIIGGNGDSALDSGEIALLSIDLGSLPAEDGATPLSGGRRWTLQLLSNVGGTVEVSRTLPPILQAVMDLH